MIYIRWTYQRETFDTRFLARSAALVKVRELLEDGASDITIRQDAR